MADADSFADLSRLVVDIFCPGFISRGGESADAAGTLLRLEGLVSKIHRGICGGLTSAWIS